MSEVLHVAVGVVCDAAGRVLVARRAADAHQGGLWEFPGGKLEPGESAALALARELREELAIEVQAAQPLLQHRHSYPEREVLLDVWLVTGFSGEPVGAEGQPLQWATPQMLRKLSFPAANAIIVEAVLARA